MHVGSDKTENVLGKISMMQAIVRNHYLNMKPNQPPPPKKKKAKKIVTTEFQS